MTDIHKLLEQKREFHLKAITGIQAYKKLASRDDRNIEYHRAELHDIHRALAMLAPNI